MDEDVHKARESFGRKLDELAVAVTADEVEDVIGYNPFPDVMRDAPLGVIN